MSVASRDESQIRELHAGETQLAHRAMRELRSPRREPRGVRDVLWRLCARLAYPDALGT
jgi:hypothetical protein